MILWSNKHGISVYYISWGKIHIKHLSKDSKCFILSNTMYLRLQYRTPIPSTYCRCDSTLIGVTVTKNGSFEDGDVSFMTGV